MACGTGVPHEQVGPAGQADLSPHPGSHQGPYAHLLHGLDDGQIPGDQYEAIITAGPERALAGA